MSKYAYVVVEWEDAHFLSDVVALDSIKPRAWLRYTVGFLLHDGEQVVVAHTLDDDTAQGVMTIPRGAVLSIRELGVREFE